MAVSNTNTFTDHTGDGVTLSFVYDFLLLDDADIQVYLGGVLQSTGYTVTGVGNQTGGTVEFSVAPASGVGVTLKRSTAVVQTAEYRDLGRFPAATHEAALDRLTLVVQEARAETDRAVQAPITDPGGNLYLPAAADRADRIFTFDSNGDPAQGPLLSSVQTAVDQAVAIDTVADSIANVNTVATNIVDVNTVATNIVGVNTVATNIVDVNTVAGNIVDVTNFADVYYGPSASDPATRRDASPLQTGDLYFNTTTDAIKYYDGSVWRSVVAPIQSSSTDTTAGALMTVGAFGLGGSAVIWPSATANDFTVQSGFYRADNTVAELPSVDYYGIAVEKAPDGAYVKQVAWNLNVPTDLYVRVITNGIAVPWRKIYHSGNILGTVLQSGGVPTGAIIERGSNSNGEYVKYADGTMICWLTDTKTIAVTSGPVSGFYYNNTADSWTFPASFSAAPVANCTARAAGNATATAMNSISTTSFLYFIVAPASIASTTYTIGLYAIGRWY